MERGCSGVFFVRYYRSLNKLTYEKKNIFFLHCRKTQEILKIFVYLIFSIKYLETIIDLLLSWIDF